MSPSVNNTGKSDREIEKDVENALKEIGWRRRTDQFYTKDFGDDPELMGALGCDVRDGFIAPAIGIRWEPVALLGKACTRTRWHASVASHLVTLRKGLAPWNPNMDDHAIDRG